MTTEIIITMTLASHRTGNYTPAENAYFTAVQNDTYSNFRLPEGWNYTSGGLFPKSVRRARSTSALP